MLAMARAARARLTEQTVRGNLHSPYDPSKIKARMAKYYRWSYSDIDNMHFVEFFAAVREAAEMNEEEKAEIDRARRPQTATTEQLQGAFPTPERYEGETVKL